MTSNLMLLQLCCRTTLLQKQQVLFYTQAHPACMPKLHVCLSEKHLQNLALRVHRQALHALLAVKVMPGCCSHGAIVCVVLGRASHQSSHAPQDLLFCSNRPNLGDCRILHTTRCTHHSKGQLSPSGWQLAGYCGSPAGPSAVHRQPHHPSGELLSPADASNMLLLPALRCGQFEN